MSRLDRPLRPHTPLSSLLLEKKSDPKDVGFGCQEDGLILLNSGEGRGGDGETGCWSGTGGRKVGPSPTESRDGRRPV